MLYLEIITLLLLILFSAFFSGIETAFTSISLIKVNYLVKENVKNAQLLKYLKERPKKLIITILIGNNLVNIAAASLSTVVFLRLLGNAGVAVSTGVMTFLILVFGEITPKTFAVQNNVKISLAVCKIVYFFYILFYPFVYVFSLISNFLNKLLGVSSEEKLNPEELRTFVNMGENKGVLSKNTAEIMNNILDFEKIKVTDIMTPKVDMKMLDGSKKLKEVLEYIIRVPYSKFPVFIEDDDNIIGVINVDTVLRYVNNKKIDMQIKNIVEDVLFVPHSKQIKDLFKEFEDKQNPIAIVVDEYGEVSGLVTVEDILEEIVGDIFDKSKKSNLYIQKINDKVSEVNAKANLEDVNKELNLNLPETEFNTIAGFIEHKLKKIPQKGDVVVLKGAVIKVEKASKRKLEFVKIIKKK